MNLEALRKKSSTRNRFIERFAITAAGCCNMIARQANFARQRRGLSVRRGFALALAFTLAGCAVASAPIKNAPQVVATPQAGQMSISAQAAKPIGEVLPVYVSVANGTDEARAIVPSQIFAINDVGERVAPLPPQEAARQAGGAGELKAALASGAVSGVAGGAVGAGLGALAGAGLGGAGTGALVGSAIGAGSGMLSGVSQGQSKADQHANEQLRGLALKPEEVRRNFTVSGYVFFPKGTYREIEVVLVNRETGDTESIKEPWR